MSDPAAKSQVRDQLLDLTLPFPSKYVHSNPSGGGSYVKHHVVEQRLLQVCGPFDFELVQVIRGHVDALPPNPSGKSDKAKKGSPALDDAIVGAVARLKVSINGWTTTVEEVGDCEQPHNWPHDGARMKDAMSDAFKRCAMRLGLGLHLYSNEEYFLHEQLKKAAGDTEQGET